MFKIIPLAEKIFLFKFDDRHELALTFLRYQEFYESPNSTFRGRNFTIEEYKEWYKSEKGEFTYTTDWSGFNIPSRVIKTLLEIGIPDRNDYDDLIVGAYNLIRRRLCSDGSDFYIIGVSDVKTFSVLRHEQAHGLYATDESYKKKCDNILSEMTQELFIVLKNKLLKLGYTNEVIADEIQAYMSTDDFLVWEVEDATLLEEYSSLSKRYVELFDSYYYVFVSNVSL